ncbi:fatty acid metabolism transcriptional regulator FadR, partial [Vibrio parahaemolyticus]|nr:fatty acid metabolism transcriptional regulator FadR [Vibrio parahaemolyticus]
LLEPCASGQSEQLPVVIRHYGMESALISNEMKKQLPTNFTEDDS